MISRLFLVGTDTAVGKTTVMVHLLHAARARRITTLPFKPAASGDTDSDSDPERLLRAAATPELRLSEICPLRYASPVAPGIAADPRPFVNGEKPDPHPFAAVQAALTGLEQRYAPRLVLIEGAGGLHVPMPGGQWQPTWIRALASHTILVGRAGLGAINHARLTIDALNAIERPPLGFVLVETQPPDASNSLNAAVIERATGIPCLGTLAYAAVFDPTATDPLGGLWDRLPL